MYVTLKNKESLTPSTEIVLYRSVSPMEDINPILYPLRFAVIEDEHDQNDTMTAWIQAAWPRSTTSQIFDFEAASIALSREEFDVVISDVDLGPGDNLLAGVKIAKCLDFSRTPLIVVSKLQPSSFNSAFFKALGAWDYLPKPIDKDEFLEQVSQAVRFRLQTVRPDGRDAHQSSIRVSAEPELQIDFSARAAVTWKGQKVNLTITQALIVDTLSRSANQIVSYSKLYEHIKSGKNRENLRVHILAIRNAFIDVDPTFDRISSVMMKGYVWRARP